MSRVDLGASWGALEQLGGSVHELRAREIEAPLVGGRHAFVALDWQGQRHLLVPLGDSVQIDTDRGSGVHLGRRTLMDRGASLVFLDVACLKPHLNALFDVVAGEMLEACSDFPPAEAGRVCRDVLERWRELLQQVAPGELPLSALAGAWGELWFVRELLRRGAPWSGLWQGPDGGVHDIVGPSGDHLEVKSTTSRGPLVVEIHGIGQLDRPQAGHLLLGVLRLRHGPDEGESMGEMVRSCVAAGADRGELLRQLGAIGVNSGVREFEATRFSLAASWLFDIGEAFPRIVPSSFASPVPPEIVGISYQLDLTTMSSRALSGAAFDEALFRVAGSNE